MIAKAAGGDMKAAALLFTLIQKLDAGAPPEAARATSRPPAW